MTTTAVKATAKRPNRNALWGVALLLVACNGESSEGMADGGSQPDPAAEGGSKPDPSGPGGAEGGTTAQGGQGGEGGQGGQGGSVGTAECPHDVCFQGEVLDAAACEPCVATVCQDDPFCCSADDGFWDAICVAKAAELCGATCKIVCGDGQCDTGEDNDNCSQDCAICGDNECTLPLETVNNCAQDCAECCGPVKSLFHMKGLGLYHLQLRLPIFKHHTPSI